MTIEALEEALKDESGIALHDYALSLPGNWASAFEHLHADILALIEKREKKAIALVDFCTNIEAAPRPLTLEDWERAMENPEELKKFQRRDGHPHNFIYVLSTDAPMPRRIYLLRDNGLTASFYIDGRVYDNTTSDSDLLLPPHKLKRVVRYVVEHFTPNVLGLSEPQSTYTKPVTLIYEE